MKVKEDIRHFPVRFLYVLQLTYLTVVEKIKLTDYIVSLFNVFMRGYSNFIQGHKGQEVT